jgi:2-methylisocitrate lyase-like PEP mutase family enzyme
VDAATQRARADTLRQLHHGAGALLLVNAWDVASALVVERAGFPAVATSSSAVASALGYPDGERIGAGEMLAAVGRIAPRLRVPLTADMEAGYERDTDGLATLVGRLIDAGAVGLNLEDGLDPGTGQLVPLAEAVERVRVVREAADAAGIPLVLNARTDVFLEMTHDRDTALDEAITRLGAYRDAGADCLFPIGARDPATIAVLVRELSFPINILAGPGAPSIRELETMGVARVSLGGGPQRAALATLARIGAELREAGTYQSLQGGLSHQELDDLVAASWRDGPTG